MPKHWLTQKKDVASPPNANKIIPMLKTIHKNIHPQHALETGLNYLKDVIVKRLELNNEQNFFQFDEWLLQNFPHNTFQQDKFPQLPKLNPKEWLILLLALVPHIKPNFFESVIQQHLPNGGDFPEFGGAKATNHRGMIPTGETAQFILAGDILEKRITIQEIFREDHFFFKSGILWLEPIKEGEPLMSGKLIIPQEWIDKIISGKECQPRFGLDFPAKHVETTMLWDDVVLHPRTLQQVKDISNWLQHYPKFMQDKNLHRKIKPGYRVLFYGPSGTGKTLTAALIGKQFGKDVYRIDLSQIVSKFIGETEKNLENVFKRAESRNWILFFDEADALFGKRTNVQSSHDKYANQEVSYLLQRVEDYEGLLILASNLKNNLDDAFIRRFHAVVHFPMPNSKEREILWQKSLPEGLKHDTEINLNKLATEYELSGASILNAVYYAALQCYTRSDNTIYQTDLIEGVRKEFLKEEKSL